MKTMSVGVSTILGVAAAVSALFSLERDIDGFPRCEVVIFTTSAFFVSEISRFARCEIILADYEIFFF